MPVREIREIVVCLTRFMIHKDNHQVLPEYYSVSVYLNAVSEARYKRAHAARRLDSRQLLPSCMHVRSG